ncbi:ABC transporter permease [Thioalbus denitrificans]|uniref:Transport permease protein n=1 Tax=Thioalbus denitrificans TaxID=547122 RepID=A0A369C2A9_9GAMM|nr:ABC transporter permease [Thioalbus denitrificans]RCX28100.1 ABC-2 type transport system permease protein [Thioalbus denitrificans]
MDLRQQYHAFKTIVLKEFLRFIRIWPQTVVPPAVTMGLYFIIFGNLIGRRIGEMGGQPYIDFIVPGLILMSVINNAYSNVVSSFFSSKFHRHIEEMVVSPTPNYVILTGFIAGGVARGLVVGVVVTGVSMFFTELRIHHFGVMLVVVLLTATLFALGGFINGIYARTFDAISIVPTFILTPLTYLGGVFYSIDMLPGFWQQASLANPILYMINAFRYGLVGVSDIPIGTALGIIIAFVVVLYLFALRLLNRGVGIRH